MFALVAFISQTPVLAATCYANLPRAQFQSCQLVAPSFALHWSVNSSIITFGIDVDIPSSSNSWIGLGLSEMGGMYGADVFLLRQNSSGSWYIQDSFATGTGLPSADAEQDLYLLSGPVTSNTNTVYTFYRAIRTCDPMDYEVLQDRQHHIIWAFGPPQSAFTLDYHGPSNRGNFILTLYPSGTFHALRNEANLLTQNLSVNVTDIRFPNITVPSVQTSYLCIHVQVPADQKYHVVHYEGIVTSNLVHHMIMYGCAYPPQAFNTVYDCANMELACTQFTMAWAPGLGQVVFPPEAGFAIGIGTNAIQYFSLQIHYNNQQLQTGVRDNSGIRLYYTNQLRKNDIGVLRLGNEDIYIPGDSKSYTSTTWNVCPSTCTKKLPGNLTVISNGFHMHTLGYNVSTRHIRDNQEMAPLGMQQYYNFFYQGQSAPIENNVVISPGDSLLTQCTYLPTYGSRSNSTFWGESTKDEMCYNFVTYYPLAPLISACMDVGQFNSLAICATDAELESTNSTAEKLHNGWLVTVPQLNYTPYSPPACQATWQMQKQSDCVGFFPTLSQLNWLLLTWVFILCA